MAAVITWSKSWSSSDDGTVFGGADIQNIQTNIETYCVTLGGSQTLTGDKTFTGVLSIINGALCKLTTSTGVDMKTAASTVLYTVPASKVCYLSHIVIRDPSASLAGGTSYSFTNFRQTVDLSSLTTSATDYIILDGNNVKYTETAAAATISITVTTGSTATCTASIDVYGYLV